MLEISPVDTSVVAEIDCQDGSVHEVEEGTSDSAI